MSDIRIIRLINFQDNLEKALENFNDDDIIISCDDEVLENKDNLS